MTEDSQSAVLSRFRERGTTHSVVERGAPCADSWAGLEICAQAAPPCVLGICDKRVPPIGVNQSAATVASPSPLREQTVVELGPGRHLDEPEQLQGQAPAPQGRETR